MLALFRQLVRACYHHNVPLSLCGEMAGSPLDAMALLGVGFRILSMAPSAVGPVKTMIRSLHLTPLEQFLATLETASDHSLRNKLTAFALDHRVIL